MKTVDIVFKGGFMLWDNALKIMKQTIHAVLPVMS